MQKTQRFSVLNCGTDLLGMIELAEAKKVDSRLKQWTSTCVCVVTLHYFGN